MGFFSLTLQHLRADGKRKKKHIYMTNKSDRIRTSMSNQIDLQLYSIRHLDRAVCGVHVCIDSIAGLILGVRTHAISIICKHIYDASRFIFMSTKE